MVDNVVNLQGLVTTLDVPVKKVLEAAIKAELKGVVVIGISKDDSQYFSSSLADGGEVLWLLESSKHRLMKLVWDDQ